MTDQTAGSAPIDAAPVPTASSPTSPISTAAAETIQDRIDRAFARMEGAARRLNQSHGALIERHARLRASVTEAVRGIDSLIAEDAK
ncbi:hypothetical protein [Sphingomonas sp. RS2018]